MQISNALIILTMEQNASLDIQPLKGGSSMFSIKKSSWKRILMALSLVALLGVASCGAHAGGHVGGVGGDVGGSAGSGY